MGPLVPEIIGNELNFVVAFFVGIAFGFILEQAGFSSSKKLVGLFYGYDFTVLRVFFTAGIVAMTGVIALSHFGLLDMSLVYINPTFLWSALVGGIIMGLGFVIGGFCPGTSVCAAAIGKIDAVFFILGSVLGVFAFAELYPLIEPLYKAEFWGNITIFKLLGTSQSLFAFLLTIVAVGAFLAVRIIENKVNGIENYFAINKKLYAVVAGIGLIFAVSAFALPDRKEHLLKMAEDKEYIESLNLNKISIDELALRIMHKDKKIQIFDLRKESEYKDWALPNSVRIDLINIFDKDMHSALAYKGKENIFIADNDTEAMKAASIAKDLGFSNISYLDGGVNKFKADIINFTRTGDIPQNMKDVYRFREKASVEIPRLVEQFKLKSSSTVKKEKKRVLGGC